MLIVRASHALKGGRSYDLMVYKPFSKITELLENLTKRMKRRLIIWPNKKALLKIVLLHGLLFNIRSRNNRWTQSDVECELPLLHILHTMLETSIGSEQKPVPGLCPGYLAPKTSTIVADRSKMVLLAAK